MAAETFKIEIPINVTDNTDPGVSSADKKMTAFEKTAEKTKSQLDKMNKTKWQVAIEAVDKVTSVISTIGGSIKGIAGKVWSVTMTAVDKVTSVAKGIISTLGKILSLGTAVSTVLGGITLADMLDAAGTQNTVEKQLETVLANVSDAEDAMDRLKAKASELQGVTMYGDEAYLAGAAELATYLSDTDALETAMGVLADYAAGMSGGAELSTTEMVDYATQLGKALNGTSASFDGLTKKGFAFSEAQEKILKSDTTSDLEKIQVLSDVIAESWDGLAEAFAETPTARITQFKNAWGDVKEVIGNKLYPSVGSFFKMLSQKLPGVQTILEKGADWLNETFENLIPTISEWIDNAIEKVDEFGKRVSEVFNSDEFQNADFFGKIKIAWNEIVAEPFSEWWNNTGKAWFAEKASSIGEGIGSGITTGLLALLGIDLTSATEDGTSVGGAFIDGFKKGFDTDKITQALKDWAENNKEIVIGIGAIVGFNLITGLAEKLNSLTSLFKGNSSSGSGTGSSVAASMTVTSTTTTVNGSVVNVYGTAVNNKSSSGLGNAVKNIVTSGGGSLLGSAATGGLLTAGGTAVKGLLTGSTIGSTPLLTGEVAAGTTAAATGLTSATSWLSSLLQLGSTSSVISADGTLLAVQGGLGGTLGSIGGALGSTATTAAGAAAAGTAGTGGIIGGILGLGSAAIDLFQGIGKSKEGDSKGAKDEYVTAGTKAGMVGAGAGIGAAIGSIIPGAGTAIGALVGAGVGGIGALVGGNKAGKAISDSTDEGGMLNTAWKNVKEFGGSAIDAVGSFFTETVPSAAGTLKEKLGGFFTETLPQKWNGLWTSVGNFFTKSIPEALSKAGESVKNFFTETIPEKFGELMDNIGSFFTETVPYALGYAVGKIQVFFTETIPEKFGELWEKISSFFTDTLPTWVSGIWNDHIVPFFTEDVPEFFGNLWDSIATFFTDTLPTWASGIWNDHIVPFFTESVPEFFGNIWDAISTFFTDTLPTWASDIWNNHVVPFFTEDIPEFFSNIWDSIVTFFTDTLPTWASNIWNDHIVPFFTETVPEFFTNIWDSISTFFTDTLPTWVSNIWNNNIVPFFTESIPSFLSNLWSGVVSFVTESIPSWVAGIGQTISGWFSSIKDWFSQAWENIKSSFSFGYSDATSKHAWGGFMNSPHVGMVAEDGPEAIIPLSPSKSARGLDLWMKAGQYLGVQPFAEGGIVSDTRGDTPTTVSTEGGTGNNTFEIKVEVNPEFTISGDGMDEETVVAIIKARIREMADDIGDELAERLARIFANMPTKGWA